MLFAYFGPETFLPLTSVLSAVVGFFLLFGRSVRLHAARLLRRSVRRGGLAKVASRPSTGRPHIHVGADRVEVKSPAHAEPREGS